MSAMKLTTALLAVSGMTLAALALQPEAKPVTQPDNKQPPAPAQATSPATPALAVEPPAPKGLTVPDGPVIKKTELEGGLIVEDIKIGDGYEVKPGGAVVAHYHGTLKADGKVFDSSFQRGEPIAFPLSGVIQGWSKGVPGMKVGGIRRLTIPAALGYGEHGAGDAIPPNADLVFVIQLVDALQVEDVKEGTGEACSKAAVAVTTYTIKDKDGKEIEKCTSDKPYIWLPGEYQAIQFGLEGMKVGGVRKLTVPKEMNETAQGVPTTRPNGVPCTIEVELQAVRNLPQRGR